MSEGSARIPETLLRLGINRTGRLDANRAWDIALRAGIVCDLVLADTIEPGDDPATMFIDTESTGIGYRDLAVSQLLASPGLTLERWIRTGPLRAVDIVGAVIATDGWQVKRCLMCSSQRRYETPARRYSELAASLEQIAQDPTTTMSTPMKLAVALAGALNQLTPATPLDDAPPAAAEAVRVAIREISHRFAAASSGQGGGLGG